MDVEGSIELLGLEAVVGRLLEWRTTRAFEIEVERLCFSKFSGLNKIGLQSGTDTDCIRLELWQ